MRYPKFLKPEGEIGFVAPSFGCAIEPYRTAFENALKIFKAQGYKTWLGENCYATDGCGISNEPKKCSDEFVNAYVGEPDVLISCGGGELMCEILEFVDFEKIRAARPKWFMGYSDNTNLTFLLNTLADTASIYGPCAASFGMEPWHESIGDAFDLITGKKSNFSGYERWEKESLKSEENPLATLNATEPRVIRLFKGKTEASSLETSGRLVGGCMDCLNSIVGTRFDAVAEFNKRYGDEGILWFLESCDLNVFDIRRALWHMKMAGWFERASGFLIGRPGCNGTEMMGLDQYSAVVDALGDMGLPIFMDLDIGHLPPQMPLISGAYATVSAEGQKFSVDMRLK